MSITAYRMALATLSVALATSVVVMSPVRAVDLIRITPANFDQVVPVGKEVDAIYGDWVLRNDRIVAVIAQPVRGRNANMTVRVVGGMLIDLTTRDAPSDQLSCFYPAGARYEFADAAKCSVRVNGGSSLALDGNHLQAKVIEVTVQGQSLAGDGTSVTVVYTLRENQDWIDYKVTIHNGSQNQIELPAEDVLRCDGNLFRTGTLKDVKVFYAEDQYFGQCYGIVRHGDELKRVGGRNMQLQPQRDPIRKLAAGGDLTWRGAIGCSQGLPGIRQWGQVVSEQSGDQRQLVEIVVRDSEGPLEHAKVELHREGESLGVVQTQDGGRIALRLLPGQYGLVVRGDGVPVTDGRLVVGEAPVKQTFDVPTASRVRVKVVDGHGEAIPAKVQFVGIDGTPSPDFGPDSAISAIKNVVYSAHGRFVQRIDPGKYRVIVSHGPEYDAATLTVTVEAGKTTPVEAVIRRVVDSTGWISADFHSHSTPSGDNVSHQTGRVLNLLAEHIEFAPCTEHNRIDTYVDDLQQLGAEGLMATCSGMELTGNPLPVNHQNAFPLIMHAHHQDNGAPQTDADPVKQIERLALWDNASEKVVQGNHPNIPQILGDRDLDGKPDEGFRAMFGWMDVIEVHPPQGIFTPPSANVLPDEKRKNPIFYWLQLLNLGYRIPGVINTDAHYNFHGSGWYRNYLRSSTDKPSEVSIEEMIHTVEHGRIIMSTAPFLEVTLIAVQDGQERRFDVGDDVRLTQQPAKLHVRVQCANWYDVNRVQVFANGRPIPNLNFTRRNNPQMFSDQTVRFESTFELPVFSVDTHLVVAAIGEGLKLGPVMGPDRGELPPVAVSNPIFLDVNDQAGFQPNGDDLGVPFMLPE